MNQQLKKQIIEQEIALLSFEVRRSVEKLKVLLSEEFREIGASGAYFSRQDVLNRLPKEESWSAKTSDFEFRLLSKDIAQLTFKAFIKHDDKDEGIYSVRSSIWKNESGSWKMIFHQGTKRSPFEITQQT